MTAREKALREALEEIARICRDCRGQPETYAYTVGRVGSIAKNAVEGGE
jgi:hypothetical protein